MHRPPRSCRPSLPIGTLAALALLGTSCVHHDGRALHLGWREYPHERELTLEPQDLERLLIEVAYGDLELLGVEGPTRIVATLHERHPGAGELWLEDGRLGVRSRLGDDDEVLGAVRVELGTPLVELVLGSGAGDVTLEAVRVSGPVTIESGAGDVRVTGELGALRLSIETGAGDVALDDVTADEVRVETGAGDVRLSALRAVDARLETGVGDLQVEGSTVEHLQVETGVGDVRLRGNSLGSRRLGTGLGDVIED